MIFSRFDKEQAGGILMYRGGETCFHCGQAVWSDRAIHWHGRDDGDEVTNLLFHPGCAVELTIRLLRDVGQLGLEVHLKPARLSGR